MPTEQMSLFDEKPQRTDEPRAFSVALAPDYDLLIVKRYEIFRDIIKPALIAHGLYGYPDIIRNPDGPWDAWKGAGGSPDEHDLCWPAHYSIAFRGESIEPIIRVAIRGGQEANPAVLKALAVLKPLGILEVETDSLEALPYYRRHQPKHDDEMILGL